MDLDGFNIIGRDSEIGRRAMSDPEAPWKSSAGMASSVTPPDDRTPFERAAAAMVELAAAWAKLHDALVAMGQDKALRP